MRLSVGLTVGTGQIAARPVALTAARWRMLLLALAAASAVIGFGVTAGAEALRAVTDAGPELVRLLRLMTVLKSVLGLGALALVSLRFRFPVEPRTAFGYLAGGALMAAGPGVMWNMAHIGWGALLFHSGLAVLFILAWMDGGTKWRVAR